MLRFTRSPSPVADPEYASGLATPPLTVPPRSSPPPEDPHGGIRRLAAMGGGMASQLRDAYVARPPVPPKVPGVNAPPPERRSYSLPNMPPPLPRKVPGVNAPPDSGAPAALRRSSALRRPRRSTAPASTAAADLGDKEALALAGKLGIECFGEAAVARMLITDYQPKRLSQDFQAFVAATTTGRPRGRPQGPRPPRPAPAFVASGHPMAEYVHQHTIGGLAFNTLSVPSDGDCLHHALHGRTLALDEVRGSRAFLTRQMRPDEAVDYQVEMRDSLLQSKVYSDHPGFNEGHADNLMQQIKATPFDAYVALQRVPGMHGGLPELQTWSRATGQNVTVLDHGSERAIAIQNGAIVAQRTLEQYGAEAGAWPAAKTLFFKDHHWQPVDAASLRRVGG